MSYTPSNPPRTVTSSQTLIGALATVSVPIFRITGTVLILQVYGVVTTTIGATHTAEFLRLNDQTTQTAMTNQVGVTALSAAAIGSFLFKSAIATTALKILLSSAGRFQESGVNTDQMTSFVVTKKSAANTDIEYTYTTVDNPTTGVIKFYCVWLPLSDDGAVAGL